MTNIISNDSTSSQQQPPVTIVSQGWYSIEEEDKTQLPFCILRRQDALSRMPMFTFWQSRWFEKRVKTVIDVIEQRWWLTAPAISYLQS